MHTDFKYAPLLSHDQNLKLYCGQPVALDQLLYSPLQVMHVIAHSIFGTCAFALLVFFTTSEELTQANDEVILGLIFFILMTVGMMIYHGFALYELLVARRIRKQYSKIIVPAGLIVGGSGLGIVGSTSSLVIHAINGKFESELLPAIVICAACFAGYLAIAIATIKLEKQATQLRNERAEEFEILYPKETTHAQTQQAI